MSIGNQYTKYVAKTDTYSLTVSDDIVNFVLAAPGTATLPFSKDCTIVSGQNQKIIINASGSNSDLTIAVKSGDTLVGTATLQAGYQAFLEGNQALIWNSVGGSGVSGTSGFSGYSGASGFSGYSGKSGYSGYSGISGRSGTSGYSGFTGFSGYSGISGYSGYSAFSGYSGASGFSGYSGI